MERDRYQQLKRIFLEAVELAEEDRAAFVADACVGDEELRRHVEVLLGEHAVLSRGDGE